VVLLLEPDPDLRELLASALERDRLVVHTAADGRSGLRLFYSRRPDLVALDLDLPELDGWAVLERIRELSSVPVIALAKGEDQCCVRALRGGADDWVSRSVTRSRSARTIGSAPISRPRRARSGCSISSGAHSSPVRRGIRVRPS